MKLTGLFLSPIVPISQYSRIRREMETGSYLPPLRIYRGHLLKLKLHPAPGTTFLLRRVQVPAEPQRAHSPGWLRSHPALLFRGCRSPLV